MSFDKQSLIRLFNRINILRKGFGWISKKKLDDEIKEWRREDQLRYSALMEALHSLENIEKY